MTIGENTPSVVLDEPTLVAIAPSTVQKWGYYQFPSVERLSDGQLLVQYQLVPDDHESNGKPTGKAVSYDNGKTWKQVEQVEGFHDFHNAWAAAVHLPDGDTLAAITLPSLKVREMNMPKPFSRTVSTYTGGLCVYRLEDLPESCVGWRFVRRKQGETEWKMEYAEIRVPGQVRTAWDYQGVLVLAFMRRMRLAPDGSLFGVTFWKRIVNGKLMEKYAAALLRSTDSGRTWELQGEIPYAPDIKRHAGCENNEGFTEPDIAFLPDGSIYALLRTADSTGNTPMYSARSTDFGRTWSQPKVFDDFGVFPQLLVLANGVTLASYGRPGLFVRASEDPSARVWGPRKAVLEPVGTRTGENMEVRVGSQTCAYTCMLPMDDNKALLVYSHFTHIVDHGEPRKSIKVRTATATPTPALLSSEPVEGQL